MGQHGEGIAGGGAAWEGSRGWVGCFGGGAEWVGVVGQQVHVRPKPCDERKCLIVEITDFAI